MNGSKMNIFLKANESNEILIHKNISKINFVLEENAKLVIKHINNNALNIQINGQLKSNASVNYFIIDFSKKKLNFFSRINLIGENAQIHWKLFSFVYEKNNKKFDINFFHNQKNNEVLVDNTILVCNFADLFFSCQNFINQGAKHSLADQKTRAIVLGKETKVQIIPILKINENDVIAKHSAILGDTINKYIFYMQAKGLTPIEAKKMIIRSYLSFFVDKFGVLINKKDIDQFFLKIF